MKQASYSTFDVRLFMTNITEILQWAEGYLLSHGYAIEAPPEDVRTMPWSCVIRYLTASGYIYLKQTPPELSLEPVITQILYNKFHANVPSTIATNKKVRGADDI